MGYIALFLIGTFVGIITYSLANMSATNDLIDENMHLKNENKQLKFDNDYLRNAENRAVDYARKIKKIEDIIFNKGTIVSKYDAVEKFLKGEK